MDKTYNVFLSHSWSYDNAHERFRQLMKATEGLCLKEYFVPSDKFTIPNNLPPNKAKTAENELRTEIKNKMSPCHIVLVFGAKYTEWTNVEINIAKKEFSNPKPVLMIVPRKIPKVSSDEDKGFDALAGWNAETITDSLRALTEKPRIFISYDWANRETAERLANEFRSANVQIWIDYDNVRSGDLVPKKVSYGLDWCDTLLLLWSKEASTSKWVDREWNAAAMDLNKKIIPCLLDDTEIPKILGGVAHIDLRNRNPSIVEAFKTSLVGFEKADEWFKDERKKYDFFGVAAKKYVHKLEKRYNLIQILTMTAPVPLRGIYTRVNILEQVTSQRRTSIEELEKYFDRDRRGFGTIQKTQNGLEVVNNLQKLIVLGKPGSGKTTFLKYLVLQALDGKLSKKLVPIFVGLKDFSDSHKSFIDFIIKEFDVCGIPDAKPYVERILRQRRGLLLLDGLDEVGKENKEKIIRQIKEFSNKFCDNQFIISCRIAAYNHWFEGFTVVEMADFNDEQIKKFIYNWFGENTKKATLCWKKLNTDKPVRELASVPLLLTLLCLAFDENIDFPKNRAELYNDAFQALLRKWDSSRSIKRDEIYKYLSPKQKESMFSRIAKDSFEKSQYFFPRPVLEKHIANFIEHLPEAKKETLKPDSEAILQAIEAQHGICVQRAKDIYSFSHLTCQEYFTAKFIVDNVFKGSLQELIKDHLLDEEWREVFLLTAGMLPQADEFLLLLKNEVYSFCHDKQLKRFLRIIQRDIVKKDTPFRPEACWSFAIFLVLSLARTRIRINGPVKATLDVAYNLVRSFDHYLGYAIKTVCANDQDLTNEFLRIRKLIFDTGHNFDLAGALSHIFEPPLASAFDCDLASCLDFTRALNFARVLEHRLETIQPYLKTVELLVACLNSALYTFESTRKEILSDLLIIPGDSTKPRRFFSIKRITGRDNR